MTDRQERFVQEYMVDRNASAAARRAGYSSRYGPRLLKQEAIRSSIGRENEKVSQQLSLRREQVLQGLCEVAFHPASDESGSAVKVAGKLKALELLGKYLGLFEGNKESMEPVTVVEDV